MEGECGQGERERERENGPTHTQTLRAVVVCVVTFGNSCRVVNVFLIMYGFSL